MTCDATRLVKNLIDNLATKIVMANDDTKHNMID